MLTIATRTATALAALLISNTAFAQSAATPDAAVPDAAVKDHGDAILVTATRAATTLDRIPASITVLDKDAIDRAQDIGVTELLIRTPGISLVRNGGYGTSTTLRVRGAESDQTVVVIDGVKLNDPASAGGGYNFANMLVGDASRIEILRGPQSTLWGSQAIGGVVNIVTALPNGPLEGNFDIEAGSRETVSARAAVGGRTGPLRWRIGGQSFTTGGISAISPAFGGKEADGYTNQSVTGRAELTLTQNLSVEARAYYSNGKVDIDSTSADTPDYTQSSEFVGYAGINLALFNGRLRNRVAYSYSNTDRDNYGPTRARPLSFESSGDNRRFEYQGSLAITKAIGAVFGLEQENSEFRSRSPAASLSTALPSFTTGDAAITSVYGQLNVEPLVGLTLNGGIRYNDHSRYGGQTLFSGGAIWNLPSGTVLRASYGEGFKAPTLYQLFSEYGNQALAPEQARGWEAGVEQRLFANKLSFGATYFERSTTNQIVFNSCTNSSTNPLCLVPGTSATRRSGFYENVSRSEAWGIEAVAALHLGSLSLDGNYSWTATEDRSAGSANIGNWLQRRPRNTANGSLSYVFPFGVTAGAAIRWAGHSFDNAANTLRLESYTLVDLRAEVSVSDQLRLFARVENLFDESYMVANRYGTLGRSVYAGIRGRF